MIPRTTVLGKIIVALFLYASSEASGNLLIDDFSAPFTEAAFASNQVTLRPLPGVCQGFEPDNVDFNNRERCAAGVQQNTNILGGNRDVFAMILARTTVQGTQNYTVRVSGGQLTFDLDGGIAGYLRIEWDGDQAVADDLVQLTNEEHDLPVPEDDTDNPFYDPNTVENLDQFFGWPREVPGADLLSGGVDNDDLLGKMDHSTVDKTIGLGGIDLTEGWGNEGLDQGRFEFDVAAADQDGFFRLTLYSGETKGSFFSGKFSGGAGTEVIPFTAFSTIPTQQDSRNDNPLYTAVDFTKVTALVFELLNENSIDATLAAIRTVVTPRSVPISSTGALISIGLLLLFFTRRHLVAARKDYHAASCMRKTLAKAAPSAWLPR